MQLRINARILPREREIRLKIKRPSRPGYGANLPWRLNYATSPLKRVKRRKDVRILIETWWYIYISDFYLRRIINGKLSAWAILIFMETSGFEPNRIITPLNGNIEEMRAKSRVGRGRGEEGESMIRDERTYYVIKLRCILPEKGGKNGNRCYDTNYAPLAKKQRRIRNRRSSSEVRALSRGEYYFRLKLFPLLGSTLVISALSSFSFPFL